jgi:hypothetical protein
MHRRAIVLTAGCIIVVVLTALAPSAYARLAAPSNQPPRVETPSPPDGATGVRPGQVLSWVGVDDDGDPLTYAVACGTSPYPWPIVDITTLTSYTPTLSLGTKYYWAIAATDGITTVVSPVWWFTTNYPPHIESLHPGYECAAYPHPPSWYDWLVPPTQILSWSAVDHDSDPLTYTVSLGTSAPPPIVATTTLTYYTPTLDAGIAYYWVLTVSDGLSDVSSPVWCFTTARYVYLPVVLRNY